MFWLVVVVGGLMAVSLVVALVKKTIETGVSLLVTGLIVYFVWIGVPATHAPLIGLYHFALAAWAKYGPWATSVAKQAANTGTNQLSKAVSGGGG